MAGVNPVCLTCLRAAPVLSVKAKIIVTVTVWERSLQRQQTAFSTVNLTMTRTSGAALRETSPLSKKAELSVLSLLDRQYEVNTRTGPSFLDLPSHTLPTVDLLVHTHTHTHAHTHFFSTS